VLDAFVAIFAALAGVGASFLFQRWSAERERREVLLKRYLAQLQEACESLWFRLKNLGFGDAALVTEHDYLVTTTMYTLGCTLGMERVLALEGLYPEIWKRFPTLKPPNLERRAVDDAVQESTEIAKELQHYDRIALADAAVQWEDERFRQSTFLEFRQRVGGEGSERDWWAPARESVSALENNGAAVSPLMKKLKLLVTEVSKVTMIKSALEGVDDPTIDTATTEA